MVASTALQLQQRKCCNKHMVAATDATVSNYTIVDNYNCNKFNSSTEYNAYKLSIAALIDVKGTVSQKSEIVVMRTMA